MRQHQLALAVLGEQVVGDAVLFGETSIGAMRVGVDELTDREAVRLHGRGDLVMDHAQAVGAA